MPNPCPEGRLPVLSHWLGLALAFSLVACQQAAPPPVPVPAAPKAAAPAPPATVATAPAAAMPPLLSMPSRDFLPGPLYFCESTTGRTPIDLEPRVDQLCRRHPEMGPCQYERGSCRARGGRVYTARGEEVTPLVEIEYDRVVRRVRFQADAPPAPRR